MSEISQQVQDLGIKPLFINALAADEQASQLARVARVHRSQLLLWSLRGEFELETGRHILDEQIAVGDCVLISEDEQPRLLRVLPRENALTRRAAGERVKRQLIAANLDALFIVCACNEDFSLERLERYLVIALQAGIQPVVVLTKADAAEQPQAFVEQAQALLPALPVVALDARNEQQVAALQPWAGAGQTVALVGSSGVGKSTITNHLGLHENELPQLTGAARKFDDKGRHTTTARSLHRLADGGWVVDTPGMREIKLPGCEQGLQALFPEMQEYLGGCRFNDCQHEREPGCQIQTAISEGQIDARRWASYAALDAEQRENESVLQISEQKKARRTSKQKRRKR